MEKIAFCLLGNKKDWDAGLVYITSLLRALQMTVDNKTFSPLVLSTEGSYVPQEIKELVHQNICYPTYQRWTVPWFLDQAVKKTLRHDLNRSRFLSRHRIKVIAFGEAPQGSRIPWLSWLPDFQHIHLPGMFSGVECEGRNRSFMRIAKTSTRVVLLSESVKRDFDFFALPYTHKARVVRPASYIPPTVYETSPKSVADAYNLPERFIYLPNQCWKHKNHSRVFQAVRLLKDQGIEVVVVCSGNLLDYRHPNYFSELLQMASHLKIRNQIVFLGSIPRDHVFALIRQSICVLNPSLFEGFGLTTDEARSVGKQTLLSDISAHREQNPPRAIFFDPSDEQELASKLKLVWSQQSPGPDFELEAEARETLPSRLRLFGESFMSVLREVIP
jgi:glycosyltransferase involved in cell wall biosynthesis